MPDEAPYHAELRGDVRWYVCHYCDDYAVLNPTYFVAHMTQQHNGGVSEEQLLDLPVADPEPEQEPLL